MANQTETRDEQNAHDISEFGSSIACLLLSIFSGLVARYLGPGSGFSFQQVNVPVDLIFSWFFYLLAAALFVFCLGFWGVAMRNHPEMSRFFRSLWGGGEEGWRYAGQSVFLLVAISLIHLISSLLFYVSDQVSFLQWLVYLAWIVRLGIIVLGVFAAVLLAYTFEHLFIKPILNSTLKGGETFYSLLNQVRKRLTVVLPILIALGALVLQLWP